MFKLFVFVAVLAVASAGVLSPVAYTGYPYAYAGAPALTYAAAAPAVAYSAPAVAYSAPAVAYSAPAVIPAPVTYTTGYKVAYNVEPVEQHGYKIAY